MALVSRQIVNDRKKSSSSADLKQKQTIQNRFSAHILVENNQNITQFRQFFGHFAETGLVLNGSQ